MCKTLFLFQMSASRRRGGAGGNCRKFLPSSGKAINMKRVVPDCNRVGRIIL